VPPSLRGWKVITSKSSSVGRLIPFNSPRCPTNNRRVGRLIHQKDDRQRISEHGWTPAGRLWFGFELSLQTMTAGGIRIVSFVAELVQGEWNVYLPDNTACGSVTCRENFIWSLRKAFALLGAENWRLSCFRVRPSNARRSCQSRRARAVRTNRGSPSHRVHLLCFL
jgi:hypothetical protein